MTRLRVLVGDVRPSPPAPTTPAAQRVPARFRVEFPQKVVLLPGRFRGSAYIKLHVQFVLTRDADEGERHVQRNLVAIRQNLEKMGVGDEAIDAELRIIECAVRREIWRQVLLPDGDQ